ncbi:DExH-box ATP-dependent RNA helicase DExH7, chloroplastic isoform X1 [Amborella trichopoda]|uniref:DExH-box ATP-dependent RNA helicase DExH7, chloroplastic isoform X1 n=2 Tax=Amborella trichopoda TaxID=13333 RepID=UPI0009BD4753|nr:DExH-box ATP-dependent RNA helicase DExH7, chloroplastic isoform X1 [Amborella trichopoda]|eukprot:XP_020527145.1 DExH-box ATP-dependent RNA helicase DExH7, chloroplastic isoform X1 [Amborella trichopoda]
MPPKKNKKGAPAGNSKSSDRKNAPKVQLSAENERKVRQLLLNSGRNPISSAKSGENSSHVSITQRAKKLEAVYEKLSCEGFRSDQIEHALSALKDEATFEMALDWLCLNIPGNELPSKFSTGTSRNTHEATAYAGGMGSVNIISSAREDWVPSKPSPVEGGGQIQGLTVRHKGNQSKDHDNLLRSSQADWIRQYMEQQEEDDVETYDDDGNCMDDVEEVTDPRLRAVSIAKEFHAARLAAAEAKEKRDKKGQELAGQAIRKLKQEMSSLGLSEDILAAASKPDYPSHQKSEAIWEDSMIGKDAKSIAVCDGESALDFPVAKDKSGNTEERSSSLHVQDVHSSLELPVQETDSLEKENLEEVELGALFSEDVSTADPLPPEVLKLQRKEKLGLPKTSGKKTDMQRKGDSGKIPKAVLQQQCQKLGWGAPKYNKLSGSENEFRYSVSVLRTATGRGKNRKAGGLITFEFPNQDEAFESAEDAQNGVATFALYRLFADLPLYQLISEPYSSFVMKWHEGEGFIEFDESEDLRRASFVKSLLVNEGSSSNISGDVPDISLLEMHLPKLEQKTDDNVFITARTGRMDSSKEAESKLLKQELENKLQQKKYLKMLEARNTLPMAEFEDDLLQLLHEHDAVVVSGETGCGKTTQVPQFILDDMIKTGVGGFCNIVCTQPRRIAAISVAERVAEERCEPPPGSNGSLVGYQVRLDSARNEKTRLLFCTTGILLRKLAGDRYLTDISHVIVDEVHERSLLNDFLLIVLRDLIERQSSCRTSKLKVVLMSATVDASLFSKYFGGCPIVTAQGRTHPVSTCFLEDIYENLEYRLASDSPSSLMAISTIKDKLGRNPIANRRGKKNLVLGAWGDDDLLTENYINPHYDGGLYAAYTERTHQNLKNLNEDVIDYDLLEDLIYFINRNYSPGSILVFLPGLGDIHNLLDKLAASYQLGGLSGDWLLPLHSSLSASDQRKVFQSPPENIRKVIVATDIAETSITIDDVVYVIDTGKHKENRYNPQKKMSSIVEDWISRANAKQRHGRAGRVKPGNCFCLYTQHRYEKLMRPYQVPEMLRVPLVELCLQIKSLSFGDVKSFLLKAMDPPREEAVSSAIATLYEVGALEGYEELTSLGHHLSRLPVDVQIGKMMLYGGIFGCLSPILSIAAFLSYKLPFLYPKDEKQNAERAKSSLLTDKSDSGGDVAINDKQSDHLLLVIAYSKWVKMLREKGTRAAQNFCRSYFLSSSVMYTIRDMRIQLGTLLADIGFINLPKVDGKSKDKLDSWFDDINLPFNMYSKHSAIILSMLCAGLYPNVAATKEGSNWAPQSSSQTHSATSAMQEPPRWFDGRREVYVHPSSINSSVKQFCYPFLVYLEKVETSKVFLRDTSVISPYSILLFGGPINVHHQTGLVTIDGWLRLTAPAQTAVLFKELRLALRSILNELIQKPEKKVAVTENEVVRSIIRLLLEEDKFK